MARAPRRTDTAAAVLLLLAPLAVKAQVSDVPDLSTATDPGDESTAATTGQTSRQTNTDDDDAPTTARTTGQTTRTPASSDADGSQTSASFIATATDNTASVTGAPAITSATSVFGRISDAPTIAGAGIPQITVPWTAGAAFMQKSTLPEGTVFIAVGAVLAFFGACVLLWRGTVAWSINRSVKRAALASVGASEKSSWGGSTARGGYRTVSQKQSSLYKDPGSSMSLDQLTSAGKPLTKPHFRDSTIERRDTPPADLFFSPTAKVSNRESTLSHRNSAYMMPSGYYASPNSAPAGGAPATTLGGDGSHLSHSSAPYANRNSHIEASPPSSPNLPPARSSVGMRASGSRDGLRAPPSREGRRSYLSAEPRSGHSSALYAQPSSSSLMVGSNSVSDLGGSRAPSAYLEDLFENHGNGPRERF